MKQAIFTRLESLLASRRTAAIATIIAGPGTGSQMLVAAADPRATGGDDVVGGLGTEALDEVALEAARRSLVTFEARRLDVQLEREHEGATVTIFVDVYPPPRTLIVVGGVHVAIPLVGFARTLGWRTAVVDPRTAFLTPERFPEIDVRSHDWPDAALAEIGLDASSYVATLSHDDKLDVPALQAALESPARYIGALGSRKTHAKRVAALRDLGFGDDQLSRIHNPIGLPLGGRKAEEIAVSILAEIVAVDHGSRDRAARDWAARDRAARDRA